MQCTEAMSYSAIPKKRRTVRNPEPEAKEPGKHALRYYRISDLERLAYRAHGGVSGHKQHVIKKEAQIVAKRQRYLRGGVHFGYRFW